MINGFGGVFIFSNDPGELAQWYASIFKLEFESFGDTSYIVFWSRDDQDQKRRFDSTFSIMKSKVELPAHQNNQDSADMYGDRNYMINLRVDNMDAMLAHLNNSGVQVLASENEDYGLFAWIFDPDGNRIELYQPIRDDY